MEAYFAHLATVGLLTPLATVFTAIFGFSAIFINNWYVRKNLTKQIEAQAIENKKSYLRESKLNAQKEKRLKLEQLHEHLQMYVEQGEQQLHKAYRAGAKGPKYVGEADNYLETLTAEYMKVIKYRTKAEVLAHAYSDTLGADFENFPILEAKVMKYMRTLTSYRVIFDETTETIFDIEEMRRTLMKNAHAARCSTEAIREIVGDIEKILVQEIRESMTLNPT